MKRVLRLVVAATYWLCISLGTGYAQSGDSLWWNRSAGYVVPIEEVAITGRRPMKEIGLQETRLEERVLHENIASSMADILTFNSSIFVKQHGRATLSTIAFRGTSASHTQVLWNGLKIHSPLLGTTDFSLIPATFIDQATLLHGASSVSATGGGLGGAIELKSHPTREEGLHLQFTQGVGSYTTIDDFLRLDYGHKQWHLSTRIAFSSSQNDFHYTNYKRKEPIYDEQHQLIGSYYPTERNRNCAFRDLHLLQEVSHTLRNGDLLHVNAWYLQSRRGIPMLMVDYNQERDFRNEQRERTLRSVVGWRRLNDHYKVEARAGYTYSWQAYDYEKELGDGTMNPLITSRNRIHTLYAEGRGEYYLERWLFTASLTLHQHWVESRDERSLVRDRIDQARTEVSAALSARWSPHERVGLSLILREEFFGGEFSPLIPVLAADYLLSKRGNLLLKGSLSRNYRYPTLNDLYYKPGGNPDLKPEQGIAYDLGLSFAHSHKGVYRLQGEVSWFDSYIDDWILWQPTAQGYWRPQNLKKVHAYGVEVKASWQQQLSRDWQWLLRGNFSWSPSINKSDPLGKNDRSVGKQLVYIPEFAATVGATLSWRTWRLSYQGNYYSERFTSTDNDTTSPLGVVKPYFLSEASLEKQFPLKRLDLSLKFQAKNLFDIEYESVLARPMPGIHFEFFLDIRPHWGVKRKS